MNKKRPLSRKSWKGDTIREQLVAPMNEWPLNASPDRHIFSARVVEVHKGYAYVSKEPSPKHIDLQDVWLATIPRKFFLTPRSTRKLLAVGDMVCCEPEPHMDELPRCRILKAAPRRNQLSRVDTLNPRIAHVIAANVDKFILVSAVSQPAPDFSLLDRYLVLAEMQGIEAILLFNKKDLLGTLKAEKLPPLMKKIEYYRHLGYRTLLLQANVENYQQQSELKTLKKSIKQNIVVFAGRSGAGKSSLVNLYSPSILQAVDEQGTFRRSGRHTTTFASLLALKTGGYVIDTPGVKRLALEEIQKHEVSGYFRDLAILRNGCQYRTCLHESEPQCEVLKALKKGVLPSWRYHSYLSILRGRALFQ